MSAQKCGSGTCKLSGIPVTDLEKHVFDHLRIIFADADMIERILEKVEHLEDDIERSAVLSSLRDIGAIWDELFAAEQQRIASLLIQGVEVGLNGVALLLLSGESVLLSLRASRRCGRTRIVSTEDAEPEVDSLHLSIAKGCKWLEELESSDSCTIKELADLYQVEPAYMRRHLKLALLPPSRIESILNEAIDVSVSELFKEDWSHIW
ncbi:MAG: hypothetical protein HRU15_06590 [Planctomycetes bacterium]|nr:hypothetical protein [Planctomycetota bacterium]